MCRLHFAILLLSPCSSRDCAASRIPTLNNQIRSNNADLKRQAGASVDDSADLPLAEDDIASSAEVVLFALAERQIVKSTQVEGMAHVEVVIPIVIIKII